jgi:hypothetical protein
MRVSSELHDQCDWPCLKTEILMKMCLTLSCLKRIFTKDFSFYPNPFSVINYIDLTEFIRLAAPEKDFKLRKPRYQVSSLQLPIPRYNRLHPGRVMLVRTESAVHLFVAQTNGEVLKFHESRLLALLLCFSCRPQVWSLLSDRKSVV